MTESQIANFVTDMQDQGLPAPATEYRFDAVRKWRFDFAWPADFVAVEVQGGIYTGGRHVRGDGAERDMEKINAAQLQGWIVLLATPRRLATLEFAELVKDAVGIHRQDVSVWADDYVVGIPRGMILPFTAK